MVDGDFVSRPKQVRPGKENRGENSWSRSVHVKVWTLAGRELAELRCSPSDTVYEVKQRLSRLGGDYVGQQHLVHGCVVLQDSDRLARCCPEPVVTEPTLAAASSPERRCSREHLLEDGGDRQGSYASCASHGGVEADAAGLDEACPSLQRGGDVTQPSSTAASCEMAVALNCIRIGPSSLAAFLERSVDAPRHSAVADVADSVMRHEHAQSERRRPCPARIAESIDWRLRAKLVSWMMEAFDIMVFNPELLFGTVLTFDRFCATVTQPMEHPILGEVLLAAISAEMKVATRIVSLQGSQELLRHLCQGRYELEVIMKTEHALLTRLDFSVGMPTSLTFFEGLSLRLQAADQSPAESARWLHLGMMLLSLALLDTGLQYRRSHAVLAAGALSGALGVADAPPERRAELIEDLGAYLASAAAPAGFDAEAVVLACEEELLELWTACAARADGLSEFFVPLERQFGSPGRSQVSRVLSPTRRLAELRGE